MKNLKQLSHLSVAFSKNATKKKKKTKKKKTDNYIVFIEFLNAASNLSRTQRHSYFAKKARKIEKKLRARVLKEMST